MQGLLFSAAIFRSRALSALGTSTGSQCLAAGLSPSEAVLAQRVPGWSPESAYTALSSICAGASGSQALCTSASAGADGSALAPRDAAASLPPSTAASLPPPLHLDGSRRADPGEPRYTAPYWVPEDVRRAQHLPAVLFTDPWPSHDEPELRRLHARLCMEQLRLAGRPLNPEQIRDAVNDQLRRQAGDGAPLLATSAYVKLLMEHLRRSRLVYGRKNPESVLSAGHREHPRLYVALPYQAARMGQPGQLAQEDAKRREAEVARATRRLRRGKPPYAIHRRRALFSIWQHEVAQEALRQL